MGKIELVTKRKRIKSVLSAWRRQYPDNSSPRVENRLKNLCLDTCSEKDVEEAVGNSTWTHICCDVCEEYLDHCRDKVVSIEIEAGYSSVDICPDCLETISRIMLKGN